MAMATSPACGLLLLLCNLSHYHPPAAQGLAIFKSNFNCELVQIPKDELCVA
jgi:hypothetical protein